MTKHSLIKLENVSKYYKTPTGVSEGMRDVSVEFNVNDFVAITGESGSGKTTLLNVLSGLDSYEDGEMFVNGIETSHYTVKEWESFRALNVGFVFQNYNVIDSYTVYQNILVALEAQGYDESSKKNRALELIERVGLTNHKNQKTSKLSGGQKQRVVIARALAKNAPIILADEPTGNLDEQTGKEIMELFKEISKDKLVILVTHNYEEAKPFVTRKITMSDGTIKEDKVLVKTENAETKVLDAEKDVKNDSFKTSLKIAFRNIFATPKRTIFSVALSMVAILIFLFFYSSLIKENQISLGTSNTAEIILRENGTAFTLSNYNELKNEFETSDLKIFPDISKIYGVLEDEVMASLDIKSASTILNTNDLEGRLPIAANEIIIVQYYEKYYEIDDDITIFINVENDLGELKNIGSFNFKVVGNIVNTTTNNENQNRTGIYMLNSELINADFTYNTKYMPNSEIKKLQVIGIDRNEIKLFANRFNDSNYSNEFRLLDYDLTFENTDFAVVADFVILLLWLVLIGILSIVFLVTYNVQKNVMNSRKKDFAVYRSIGISEKEVASTVLFEQLLIALIAVLLAFVLSETLSSRMQFLRVITRHINIKDYIIIAVVFAAFSVYQGFKYNKRIFNITVIESLREDI